MRPIFVVLASISTFPSKAVEAAVRLSEAFEHEVKILVVDKNIEPQTSDFDVVETTKEQFAYFAEQADAAMLVFEIQEKTSSSQIQRLLNMCRNLRMPYLFVKPNQKIKFSHVLTPVSFLEEDREKGMFASAFGRFLHARITLFPANDYGSKAQKTTIAIQTLLDSFSLDYEIKKGEKDSFGVEKEAVLKAEEMKIDLIIISASREYGLDDLIFGPKERHLIKKTTVPLLFINPRGDLYALCD